MNIWSTVTNKRPTAKCKAVRFRLSPYLMAFFMAASIAFSIADCNSRAIAQPAGETAVRAPVEWKLDASETDSTALETEDRARIEKFRQLVPERWRKWLPEVQRRVHHTPVLSYKHWSSEPKRFAPTLLFCLFTGLIGVAFFSGQITAAQECCKTQFWRCFTKASLSGITLLISVIVLDRIGITGALATALLAVLELFIVAGLSVGVSLIGERVLEKTGMAKLDYLKSHPRLTTFTKVLIGSVIIALIVQIPGLGRLPRIGIRIATLIAILGAGGLLNTKFGTQPVTSD
jgi:hypothetical protein